jgi:hypothetical protein
MKAPLVPGSGGGSGASSGGASTAYVDAAILSESTARATGDSNTLTSARAYTDASIQGLSWKEDVKCANASPAAYTYLSGVMTFTLTGAQTWDGHALVAGERVANIDGTLAAGIYTVTTATGFVTLTRATDADTAAELIDATFNVELGTANGGRTLHCVTDPITLGTTALSFTDIPSYISPGQVTLAMMANLAAKTYIGRTTNSTGVPEAVTAAQMAADVQASITALYGLALGTGTASANDFTPPKDGGFFYVTSATQMNRMDITGWAGGLIICYFSGTPTIKHNQTASGALKPILLAGGVDYTVTAGDVLGFIHDGTNIFEVFRNNYISTLPVAKGGTGAVAAAAARTNLGVSVGEFFFAFGDGTNAITTSEAYQQFVVPYDCTITDVQLTADASGSIVLYVYKTTYSSYNPGTHPVSGDSIVASAAPTLSTAYKSQDATLTGWTKALTAGDIVRIGVTSAGTVKRVEFKIGYTR